MAHGCGVTLIENGGLSHKYSNPVSMSGTLRAVEVERMWFIVDGDRAAEPNIATTCFSNNWQTKKPR